MELNDVRVDPVKVDEGVWIDIPAGGRLKIARWNNRAFLTLQSRLVDEHNQKTNGKEISSEQGRDFLNKVVSETILLDWEGLTQDGKPLPYSKEKCYEILSDPSLMDFRDDVVLKAQLQANYRADSLVGAEKK